MLLILTALAAGVTVWFIAAPFLRNSPASLPSDAALPEDRAALQERRDALLLDIKDLEFDRALGKIDADDYTRLRAEASAATTSVLDRLEKLESPGHRNGLVELTAEAEILIARARRKLSGQRAPGQKWRCACGREMDGADHFCAACGKARPA